MACLSDGGHDRIYGRILDQVNGGEDMSEADDEGEWVVKPGESR